MTRAWVFPGQGAQHRDMGRELFDRFPAEVAVADRVIGVPLRELCADARGEYLDKTRYVQPAVFAVSVLAGRAALADGGPAPDVVAGHSLGEYAALHLAGCLDFEAMLRLVVRRGELMGQATGGGMLAVLGLPLERVEAVLAEVEDVDLANHNLPDQLVLAGSQAGLRAVIDAVRRGGTGRCVPLAVSIAAHSRFMAEAAARFAEALRGVRFAPPRIPVLSNVTTEPHRLDTLPDLLCRHLTQPVRWWETLCRLARAGVTAPVEVGPGEVLTKMWRRAAPALPPPDRTAVHLSIPAPSTAAPPATPAAPATAAPTTPGSATAAPPSATAAPPPATAAPPSTTAAPSSAVAAPPPAATLTSPAPAAPVPPNALCAPAAPRPRSRDLGSAELRAAYGVRHAVLAGSLDHGVTSPELLRRLSDAGLFGFHGTRHLTEQAVRESLEALRPVARYGLAWPTHLDEEAVADLYLAHDVRYVEVAGGHTGVSPQLVRFRFAGGPRHVLVRVGDPATAARFLRPPTAEVLRRLVSTGHLTARDARVAAGLPLATDLVVDRDWPAVLPAVAALGGARVGAAGVGTPAAVAAAFALGADFVMTTNVNQATPQAATSDTAKDLLAALDVADVRDALDPDLFELGGRSPVARRGTLYAGRADRLHRLYLRHDRIEDLGDEQRAELERTHFRRPLHEVWSGLGATARDDRHRMALVFSAYCREATRAALTGVPGRRLDYRIPTGADMGAFNRFAAGTPLEEWSARHVDRIAEELLSRAAARVDR
ncbi:ACP S-malonyltransferase [Actinosynnema sp. CA-248983]